VEPVSLSIVTALAAGAIAAAKDVATSTVKDTYAALKRLIVDRNKKAAPFVEAVEANPTSAPEQQVLSKQIAGAADDPELKKTAAALLEALEGLKNNPRAAALFDFGKLRAAKNFELTDIETSGTVLKADDATFDGDFKATNIRQKPAGGPTAKN